MAAAGQQRARPRVRLTQEQRDRVIAELEAALTYQLTEQRGRAGYAAVRVSHGGIKADGTVIGFDPETRVQTGGGW